MSKQKQDKQGGGWQFPRPLEIIKCKEGNKEYMKERPKPCGGLRQLFKISHRQNLPFSSRRLPAPPRGGLFA